MTKEEKNARTLHLVQQALSFANTAASNAAVHMGHTTTDVADSKKYKTILHQLYELQDSIQTLARSISKLKDKADGY